MKRFLPAAAALSVVAATLVSGGSAAAIAKRPAAPQLDYAIFTSHEVRVTTSTHHKLTLSVDASPTSSIVVLASSPAGRGLTAASSSNAPNASNAPSSVDVALIDAKHHEDHGWLFRLKKGAVSLNPTTGKGSVATGATRIEPYGRVSLTFTPTGKTTTTRCQGTARTVSHQVNVVGKVQFNTHSSGRHSWGNVGSTKHPFKLKGRGTVQDQYGMGLCGKTLSQEPCASGIGWSTDTGAVGFAALTGGALTSRGKTRSEIEAFRGVSLPAPAHASREDEVSAAEPPPALTVVGGEPTLVIDATGSQVTGSAEMTSPTPETPMSRVCQTSHDENETEWGDASFVNGDDPLTVHEQIEGPLTVANQATNQEIEQEHQTD
jgi:hypothetical protein